MQLMFLHNLLEELGAKEKLFEIERVLKKTEFLTKCNHLTKCLISSFLFLQNEGYPIVLEDILKYSEKGKFTFLSQIKRNRSAFPYSPECSLLYVTNVSTRLEQQLNILKYSFKNPLENINFLYKKGYFYSRSPFLPLLCLFLVSSSPKKIQAASMQIIPNSRITISSIEKELLRISIETGQKQDKEDEKRNTRIKKIEKAVFLYKHPISSSSEYATDYDSLLIEEMVKNGHHPMQIYHLTRKGREYYSPLD
ncbi:hypothetical protein NEFER03_1774 [Nematocida sp. LUAm3]|nr:hypothetical protein NEFER03_1774 [Nematocida sp. LUAm3]KAI5173919.1 hypothetical protein NEFER02_0386 [Nematocida sp. LUAm2]KAI5177336.1 hypothetical protein NEFER01_0611 [Nematocida sp. LUAm1]